MLKLVAYITMLLDHIGYLFFPDIAWFRIVGRISMPLFAYGVAKGSVHSINNNSQIKYLLNLLFFALVSQVPFMLFSRIEKLNIGFTWLLALLVLFFYQQIKNMWSKWGNILGLCILSELVHVEYGWFGVLLPLLFHVLLQEHSSYLFCLNCILIGILLHRDNPIQIFSCFSLLLIRELQKYDLMVRIPKWIAYSFYPVHMLILVFIQSIIIH